MKSYSNTYIFIFSTVMVTLVAALLSVVAELLKPIQEQNVEIEKKLDILRSVGKAAEASDVDDKDNYIISQYDEFISESYVIDYQGKRKEGVDAFTVDIKQELAKPLEERNLPLFIYQHPDGSEKTIVPMRGKGLWGPIWGYMSFNEDYSTVYGAIFDHAKETPGLGAEINTDWFQAQFVGKVIFNEQGELTSIEVVKGGSASPDDQSAVDGISGGTITSKSLEEMMYEFLGYYEPYFKSKRSQS